MYELEHEQTKLLLNGTDSILVVLAKQIKTVLKRDRV